jgi:hypothetical protein
VRLDLIHEDRAPLCLASNASTSTTNRGIKPTCLTLRQQVPTGLYGVDRTRKIRPLARFLDWLGRLCRWNLGIETHLAERTTNNVALGSQWICWRTDHSGEAGAALGTANRMVTIDGARECRQRAEYSRKNPPAIERTGDIEEQRGSSNSRNGHHVCEALLARQFFPNGHIGLPRIEQIGNL